MKNESKIYPFTSSKSHPHITNHYLNSRDLLGNNREVIILHEGSEYTLRLTRQNKLLLVK